MLKNPAVSNFMIAQPRLQDVISNGLSREILINSFWCYRRPDAFNVKAMQAAFTPKVNIYGSAVKDDAWGDCIKHESQSIVDQLTRFETGKREAVDSDPKR